MKPLYIKKKKRKTKKSPKQKLKERAWKLTSEYVRRLNVDKDGMVACITCLSVKHWKKMQAGHYLDGRGNGTLFDLRGIHPQDIHCNYFGGGMKTNVKENYHKYMIKNYGQDVIEDLIRLKGSTKKYSTSDYMEMIDDLEDKLVGLDIRDNYR